MPPNSEIIISDTSCLILLSKIDELNLLKDLSNRVYITETIKNEYAKNLPSRVEIREPKDSHYQKILEMDLDEGEASAIALSLDLSNSILILDDLKGREIADKLNLKYSGTFGLILKAKQAGVLKSLKPVLNKIRNTNFRFTEDLFDTILKEAGE